MLGRVRMVQYFLPPEPQGGAETEAGGFSAWLRAQGVVSEVIGVAPTLQRPSVQGTRPVRPVGWNGRFDATMGERVEDYSNHRGILQAARLDGYLVALHRLLRSTSRPGDIVVFPFISPVSGVGCHACAGLCPTVTEWAGELRFHEPLFKVAAIRPIGRHLRSWALRSNYFVSHFNKGLDELHTLGIERAQTSFVPLGIDCSLFSPAENVASARRKIGVSATEFVIAYVARLRPGKGHIHAFEAVAHALERGVSARLLVVGDGELRESLTEAVKAMHLEEYVTFCGLSDDVREYLWAADIAMLLSSSEGPSRAVAEALACGVPVVATDVGGLPDSVIPGRTGVLVQVDDPAGAGNAIVTLCADRNLLRTLSEGARAFAVLERESSAVWGRYLHILEGVCERWTPSDEK